MSILAVPLGAPGPTLYLFVALRGMTISVAKYFHQARRFRRLLPALVRANGGAVGAARSLTDVLVRDGIHGLKRYCHEFPMELDVGDKIGYVIVAPIYETNSAGLTALFTLCDLLNKRGFPSFMAMTPNTAPNLEAPIASGRPLDVLMQRGFMAVYPEVIHGNPLNARRVTRWVLNRPGLLGGDKIYDSRELVFIWSDAYRAYVRNPIQGKLQLPLIDESIFFEPPKEVDKVRWLDCFYVGKSTWKEGYIDSYRAYEITRTSPEKRELGKIFRQSRMLYCFDNSTSLVVEARLCGCPVTIIPDGTTTWEDFQKNEFGTDGVVWGKENINGATVEMRSIQEGYARVKREFVQQLDQFVEVTRG